jgi:hypothetical protein
MIIITYNNIILNFSVKKIWHSKFGNFLLKKSQIYTTIRIFQNKIQKEIWSNMCVCVCARAHTCVQ